MNVYVLIAKQKKNFGWSYLRKYPEFADARLINLMVLNSGNMFELFDSLWNGVPKELLAFRQTGPLSTY